MIAVRHRLVTAARAMDMAWLMTSATMVRRASIWVCCGHLDDMFIDMVAFDMLQMTILKVVNMTTVTSGGVPAIRACKCGVAMISSLPSVGTLNSRVKSYGG